MTFAKLDSGIIHSSVWSQSKETRILWVTMLAMKDQNGNVWAALPGLARAANITLEECADAMKVLESPDPYSKTKDFDGIRVVAIDGGWFIVNHEKYRSYSYSDNPEAVRKREYRNNKTGHDGTLSQNVPNVPKCPGHSVSVSVSDSVSEFSSENPSKPARKKKVSRFAYSPDFERFWTEYPRKVGKAKAFENWTKAVKSGIDPNTIIAGAKKYAEHCADTRKEEQYIKHPEGWITAGRWDDDNKREEDNTPTLLLSDL